MDARTLCYLTLMFAHGGQEEILLTPDDHRSTRDRVIRGESLAVTHYNQDGSEAGKYMTAPGAVIATHSR